MTDDEKVYSVDEVNHLISEMDKLIAELKTENAALRERLEKSVEFPFKLGNRVWLFHYDEETELPDEDED